MNRVLSQVNSLNRVNAALASFTSAAAAAGALATVFRSNSKLIELNFSCQSQARYRKRDCVNLPYSLTR